MTYSINEDDPMTHELLRTDEKLGQLPWPTLSVISKPYVEPGAVLILACGFEHRADAFLEKAIENGCRGFSVLAVEYQPHYAENNKIKIEQECSAAGIEITSYIYDRCDPAGAGEAIVAHLPKSGHVYVDISGMSRLLLVQVLVALGRREGGYKGVSVLYTEALEYPPTKDEFEIDYKKCVAEEGDPEPAFISWGVQAVAVLPELTSPAMQGRATRLLAFPSFNRAQLRQAIDELQPMRMDVIEGKPPREELLWRMEAIRRWNSRAIESIPNREEHVTSTLDYRETLSLLLNIYAAHSAYDRLVISPTGSKMQSVAVAIVAAFIPDYQVVYPTPMMFSHPERHTVGIRQFYCLSLDIFSGVDRCDQENSED